jgi:plasmid stability protein
MIKKPEKSSRERMIHIRLDDETHRRLKVYAAMKGTTIQQIVESLIYQGVVES